jgi:RNA polymerase sigma-70 factor (ECF subfamily)
MLVTKTPSPFVLSTGVQAEPDDRRDRELFGLLANGDSGALGEIYDRHASALFRHALALTRHTSDAEDLVQAAFVKLATTGAPLLGVRMPASYLHRMLRAAWIDLQRRRAVGREEPIAGDVAEAGTDGVSATDDAIDVRRALARLPEPQREVIVLHLFNGFSFREIGHITGVSTFTAGSRYRLAVGRLREILGER